MTDTGDLVAVMMPPTRQPRYPHMFKNDIAIWERFIDEHGSEFLGFLYDVKVGSGTDPVPGLSEPYATMQATLSRYRIDVIGIKADRLEIFEVKPMAGTSAIGQVISYMKLFVKDYSPDVKIVGGIVTDFERPDMKSLCMEHGLKYYIL